MIDKKIVYEILESRENRAAMQKCLIDKYKVSLISFTLNIPGPKKDSPKYRKIHDIGMETITGYLEELGYKIEYSKSYYKNTGSEGYFVIDFNPFEIKKITAKIEESHPLGRIFDIDVFDEKHKQISRRDLKMPPRKCLLCDENAKVCGKQGTHSIEELLKEIDRLYETYFSKE